MTNKVLHREVVSIWVGLNRRILLCMPKQIKLGTSTDWSVTSLRTCDHRIFLPQCSLNKIELFKILDSCLISSA